MKNVVQRAKSSVFFSDGEEKYLKQTKNLEVWLVRRKVHLCLLHPWHCSAVWYAGSRQEWSAGRCTWDSGCKLLFFYFFLNGLTTMHFNKLVMLSPVAEMLFTCSIGNRLSSKNSFLSKIRTLDENPTCNLWGRDVILVDSTGSLDHSVTIPAAVMRHLSRRGGLPSCELDRVASLSLTYDVSMY